MTAATAARVGMGLEDFKNAAAATDPGRRASASRRTSPTRSSFLVQRGAGFVSGQVMYVAGGPKD